MKATELLADILRKGFTLSYEPNGVRVAPLSRLSEDLRQAIAARRSELLGLLNPDRRAASLRAEVEEIECRDFPGGFPPVLARCIGHYLAGPCIPPAEGEAAWWAGARREVLCIIETVKRGEQDGRWSRSTAESGTENG
jgi:hypothetical protein